MIKFFGQIRRQLLSESKVRKYLVYAIGEIILVVIGILIALQINTWSESKKTDDKIKSTLEALKSDLAQDSLLMVEKLSFVIEQYELNESFRARIANPKATVDTLIKIMRHEFNPNWNDQIIYNTNGYNSLNQSGLIELLSDSLKTTIKNFYNKKFYLMKKVEKTTDDYRAKVSSYVTTYTFGSTSLHDQGNLVNALVWNDINSKHLAATFNGISNFKRILFTETREELEYSISNSPSLIVQLNNYLSKY